jgi:hypothetical protein
MRAQFRSRQRGQAVSKDKKSKKKDKKSRSPDKVAAKASKGFQTLTQNPMVADVVAAALVATASALKDTNKARRLAEYAGDELEALSKKSVERGNAMWKLALDIGRHALDTFANEQSSPKKSGSVNSAPAKSTKPKPAVSKTSALKRTTQKKSAPKKTAPKKTAPKKTAPKKTAPKKTAPKKSPRTARKAK